MILKLTSEYNDYLRDESRKTGQAETISFPHNEKEILESINETKGSITIQGSRTSITGSSVPNGGHIINLSKMKKITGLRRDENNFYLTVQPGITLTEIREKIEKLDFDLTNWSDDSKLALTELRNGQDYFFPPDPTEVSASIGGMVACNASGARSYYYGSIRRYITKLRIIIANGNILTVKRGSYEANNYKFSLPISAELPEECLKGILPNYQMPKVKNSSGYFTGKNIDLIDLFVGSEGTLGLFSEIELKLIKKPLAIYGVIIFWGDETKTLEFVNEIKVQKLGIVAIEYFDKGSLGLLRQMKNKNVTLDYLPKFRNNWIEGLYLEFHSDLDEDNYQSIEKVCELLEKYGVNDNDTWVAVDKIELAKMKNFRHAVPEFVNLRVDEIKKQGIEITKLGTDMAVPDEKLKEVINMYRTTLEKLRLEYMIFGHIGNNHLHVNIIPQNVNEYNKGKKIYDNWAKNVIKLSGTISAEHGIGKLKIDLLKEMYGSNGIEQMNNLKKIFDEDFRINNGNLGLGDMKNI